MTQTNIVIVSMSANGGHFGERSSNKPCFELGRKIDKSIAQVQFEKY